MTHVVPWINNDKGELNHEYVWLGELPTRGTRSGIQA